MVTLENIGWGQYKSYEGTFFRGLGRFELPPNPSENHRLMAVLTSTEGGSGSAINGYDRCIISCGYFQWCEAAYFLTSRLLGAIAESNPNLLQPLDPALQASKAVFTKTTRGRWRFAFQDNRGEVDSVKEQRQLFLLHSTGHKGTWDDDSKAHAKLWAACMANTLVQPEADEVQVAYSAKRIRSFAMPSARKVLLDDPAPSQGWVGALRAGFLSFAGNLPAVAAKHLEKALKTAPGAKWSEDWCIHILKELTFGPKIAIYPHRYDAIRPHIEKLYEVDLPDFADELEAWEAELDDGIDRDAADPCFYQLGEVQQVLIDMGYDLGPWGADGVMGAKTKDAIMTFQSLNGLVPDGVVGSKTRAKLLEAFRAQICT